MQLVICNIRLLFVKKPKGNKLHIKDGGADIISIVVLIDSEIL